MNLRSLLACLAAVAPLGSGALAEPPPAATPPTAPALSELQAKASQAVQQQIVQVLQASNDHLNSENFSRVKLVRFTYSFTLSSSAPEGIIPSPEKVPFEVRQFAHGAKEATVLLTGYYDDASKSLRVYDLTAKAYLAAAEHPYLKRVSR